MTRFFDKLYYRYYRFQERVGNRDVAPFTSSLLIAFILMMYYFALFFLLIYFFPKEKLEINMDIFKIVSVVLVTLLIIGFPVMYLYKKRYKHVLNKYNNENTNGLTAIFFPLIAFLLFNAGWILKMLQNQGNL